MEIDIDLNKRIDWIKARVGLDALTEQYVRLQMQEAVIETVAKVKDLTIPDVSQQRELLKALYTKHEEETGYISMTQELAEGYLKSLL
jgi:hypothetical protein